MVRDDYGIKRKPIPTHNYQGNSILERIHQTIGNIICTFRVQELVLDNEDQWNVILAATLFATQGTIKTTLNNTPCQ